MIVEIPTYDIGFLTQPITCKITGVTYPCIAYTSVGWVAVLSSANIPFGGATVEIANLIWPLY